METGLAGKGVLVTGGAGGIGSACVRAFAAEGARVAIHYRTSGDRGQELARETGGVALQADLTVEGEVDRLFEAAEQELGGVDVCAAVAGFWPRTDEPVWELPLERCAVGLGSTAPEVLHKIRCHKNNYTEYRDVVCRLDTDSSIPCR